MTRGILEREHELAEVAGAAREAAAGRGCVLLVYGEAGIGKSSLVEACRDRMPAKSRMLVGHCDDLAAARVLGPFRDLIGRVGSELGAALRDGDDRDRILTALRADLTRHGHPTVLVIEDVHWADDATLDLLRCLVRRVAELPLVLMLTYRDDELGREHPLRRLLGLVSDSARRLPLRRLSPGAVRELAARSEVDADEVFAVTSGNPFFVGEVLASDAACGVPPTIVHAVLARLGRLDGATREVVEQLSVVPTAIDRRLVDALVPGGRLALAVAEERGLLAVTPNRVSFRHELTRRAVSDALPAIRRTVLNGRVLAAIVDDADADLARIVHHADQAGDRGAVLRYGPDAARAAVAFGAHREAVAHYRLVLDHSEALPSAERAGLLESYAIECQTIGEADRAVAAQQQAIELRRALGDDAGVGAGLCWLTRMQWWNGNRSASEASAADAIAVVEPIGDPRLLARAYNSEAVNDAMAYRDADAVPLARRAVELAREAGDDAILAHALNNLGVARWHLGYGDGRELIEESLRVALAAGETDHACRAYVNISWELLNGFRLDEAERYISAGIELAERAEHLGFLDYLYVQRARLDLGRGAWDEAVRSLDLVVSMLPVIRCPASTVAGRIRARRGDPDAVVELASAVRLGQAMGEPQWLGPAVCAAAEAAWLRGDQVAIAAVAGPVFDEISAPHLAAELGYWLSKAGHRVPARSTGDPYDLLAAGRWQDAARFWSEAGSGYEHAMALAESPDPRDLLTALELLDGLAAKPLARIVRRTLRDLGVYRVPRGPVAATRRNPAGLTQRQSEVLRLLADGLTNAEIAERLVLSVRTAGNHVAAVLDKLGVHSRDDAAARWAAVSEN